MGGIRFACCTVACQWVLACGCATAPRAQVASAPSEAVAVDSAPARSVVVEPAGDSERGATLEKSAPAELHLTSGEAPPRPSEPPPADAPRALTFYEALELSLSQNPDLIALRQTDHVSQAALGVAQTYPFNPFVQVQVLPYGRPPGGGQTPVNHYVLLMQTLQLAHQQRYREESAAAALNGVRWNIHQAELQNVAQTQRLFSTALYLRGVRDLVRANADLNRQLLTVLDRQFQAGQASAADVAIVKLDNRSTQQQAQLAEANYQTALLDLRRQLNLPPTAPIEPAGELARWHWRPATGETLTTPATGDMQLAAPRSFDEIVTGLAAARPDVMAARSDIDVARGNTGLAQAARTPDLQIGPYYQRNESGDLFLGFRAQTDLMVVNSGVPLVRQREAELRQRSVTWQQLQTRAELEARAALDRYERARGLVGGAASELATGLPEELRHLEEQFKAGEVDVLRIFTARTSLIQARRAYLDSLNEVALAAATVTAATALPPEALIETNDAPPGNEK